MSRAAWPCAMALVPSTAACAHTGHHVGAAAAAAAAVHGCTVPRVCRHGLQTFQYYFTHEMDLVHDFAPLYGVFHGSELFFIFEKLSTLWSPQERQLAHQVSPPVVRHATAVAVRVVAFVARCSCCHPVPRAPS